MRLLLTGNNDGPLRLLRSIARAGAPHPLAVALQKPPRGVLAEAYRERAYGIPVSICPDEASTLALCDRIEPTHILNCFANYKFRRLLRRAVCLNVHLAPLPRYRGRHPLQWALINGEQRFGVTLHEMNERWDDGAILYQILVDVPPLSSARELRERLLRALEDEFGAYFADYAKTGGTPLPNAAELGDYQPRRSPADSELLEWDDPHLILRKVHALRDDDHPAFVSIGDARYEVIDARIVPGHAAQKHVEPTIVDTHGHELRISIGGEYELALTGVAAPNRAWSGYRLRCRAVPPDTP